MAEQGPQFVSRHGNEVAVVLDIAAYRRLAGSVDEDFKNFLVSGPPFDDLDIWRDPSPGRRFEFDVDESTELGFDESADS